MNTDWISFFIPLGLTIFYGYKIVVKKQKTAAHGFMLGVMLILFILSLAKMLAKIAQ